MSLLSLLDEFWASKSTELHLHIPDEIIEYMHRGCPSRHSYIEVPNTDLPRYAHKMLWDEVNNTFDSMLREPFTISVHNYVLQRQDFSVLVVVNSCLAGGQAIDQFPA